MPAFPEQLAESNTPQSLPYKEVFLGILLAISVRGFYMLAHAWSQTPDSQRFLDEAASIAGGNGFCTQGVPEAALPPGYPLFLAGCMLVTSSTWIFKLAHLVLSASTAVLVFCALRPWGRRYAWFALVILTFSPWTGRLMCTLLSETLGGFFFGVLALLLSRLEAGRWGNPWLAAATGAVAVSLPLISPAAAVVALLIILAVAWSLRRRLVALTALALGTGMILVPWQLHQLRASGSIQPFLYCYSGNMPCHSDGRGAYWGRSGYGRWFRTWATGERDLWFFWGPDRIDQAPSRAFASEAEREQLLAATRRLQRTPESYPEYDLLFQQTARRREVDAPIRCYVLLPLWRSFGLWFGDMPPVWQFNLDWLLRPEDGQVPATPIAGTGIRCLPLMACSLLVFGIYISHPVIFLLFGFRARRGKWLIPACILLGVTAYTLVSGFSAFGEVRRNFVFYPLLLSIPIYFRASRAPFGSSSHGKSKHVASVLCSA